MEKVTPDQITAWVRHPVTEMLLESLKKLKEANKEDLMQLVLNTSDMDLSKSSGTMSFLKGKIEVLDNLMLLKEHMIEEISSEEAEELKNL